ncbi:MAG: hypothetical protein QM793_14410 [Muricomes sp.]
MKKRSTLLKVISIILIVLGAISLISSIIAVASRGIVADTYATMGIAAPTTFTYVQMFIAAAILLISGIVGVSYKSRQLVLIMGVLLLVYYIANIVYTTVTAAFAPLGLINLLLPLLYLWGWYQSN